MKIYILMFIFLSSLWGARIDEFANEVNYFRDYDSALSVAKEEHKLIMLILVADFCPWCKKFERKTLKDHSIAEKVKLNFIPVIVDKNREKAKYPEQFNSKMIPTVLFIDPTTQKSIYKSISYVKKREFSYSMDTAINLFKKKQK